ncbi:hypothetical protein, partial [Endozoicomonas atrinae]|uniref:hypothetical protein n=1 Tax=Endozoicomonas atrinae TaxID=1333660 RepID=UPI001EE75EDE
MVAGGQAPAVVSFPSNSPDLFERIIPIAFSKSLSCRQLCLGIITMHYLEQMSRRPQLPEGFNDVDF